MSKKVIGYKGFDDDWSCNGKKYKVGSTTTHRGKIKLCESGLHFCENPLDIFTYYPPTSKFAKVEATGVTDETRDDSKRVARTLKLTTEIKLDGIIKAGIKFILDKVDFKNATESATGDRSAATNTGNWSAATNTGYQSAATNTGDQSAATNTGNRSAATNTGNWSAATNTGNQSAATNTGNQSAATNTGDQSAATNTGDQSAATNTGNWSAATNTGYQSAATNTGNWSAATNTGDQSAATVEGKDSVALVTGFESKASGKKGCWLVLTERGEYPNYTIKEVRAVKVDGRKVKADKFYKLVGGEVVEA